MSRHLVLGMDIEINLQFMDSNYGTIEIIDTINNSDTIDNSDDSFTVPLYQSTTVITF